MTNAVILPYQGRSPRIHPTAFIAPGAVVVGDVDIGPYSSIWFGAVLRGDIGPIHIGARTNIQDGSVIHVNEGNIGTFVGDDVTVGHMVLLHNCRIEDRSFIGMRSVVMDGAVVESTAMLAAGAIVTQGKRVGAGQLWSGAPAKYWRDLAPDERDLFLSRAGEYVRNAQAYK